MSEDHFDSLGDFEDAVDGFVGKVVDKVVEVKNAENNPKVVNIDAGTTTTNPTSKTAKPKRQPRKKNKPGSQTESAPRQFTTKLSVWHRNTLKQAAAWNKAFGIEPNTMEGIIQMSLDDYFRKNEFPKADPG